MRVLPWLAILLLLPSVRAEGWRLAWGAIHEHSALSRADYGFTPEDLYLSMILDAGLQFGAVTDYDWALAQGTWPLLAEAADAFHCPEGAEGCYAAVEVRPGFEALAAAGDRPFVALLGYEWNNNAPNEDGLGPQYGHRNAYYLPPEPDGPYPVDAAWDCAAGPDCLPLIPSGEGQAEGRADWARWYEPCDLWEGLAQATAASGARALTIPHHPALSVTGWDGLEVDGTRHPASTDWSYELATCAGAAAAEGRVLEPLAELYSVWGSAEHAAMGLEEDPEDGMADAERVVREGALGRGLALGFAASGDSHYGLPGQDPPRSFLRDPEGLFRNHSTSCAPGAGCTRRFGHTGLMAVLLPEGEPLTREALFSALAARHTAASTGERFALLVALEVDGEERGIQGDDLAEALDLDSCEEAALRVSLDLGTRAAESLELLVGGTGGWEARAVAGATGLPAWEGRVPLVIGGQPEPWLPEGRFALYARVAAEPEGALAVPEDAAPLILEDASGRRAELAPDAGRYEAEALAAVLDSQLLASDLGPSHALVWDEGASSFALQARGQAPAEDLEILGQDAPALAALLGFRDDRASPCAASALPCAAEVPVEGGSLVERAWASPLWLRRGGAGDSGAPPRRCGCATRGPGAGWAALLLAALGARRRRR